MIRSLVSLFEFFVMCVGWYIVFAVVFSSAGLIEFKLFIGPAQRLTPLPPVPTLTATSCLPTPARS